MALVWVVCRFLVSQSKNKLFHLGPNEDEHLAKGPCFGDQRAHSLHSRVNTRTLQKRGCVVDWPDYLVAVRMSVKLANVSWHRHPLTLSRPCLGLELSLSEVKLDTLVKLAEK